MDNTTLTILGMIAAFITASVTAFLAEPVKTYFAERAKLQNIRLSLYKEIAQNFFMVESNLSKNESISPLSEHAISIKCYKNVIENNVGEYYRLDDLLVIDSFGFGA